MQFQLTKVFVNRTRICLRMNRILLIQTAFIGDVILATSLLETIHASLPEAKLDMVVRKGNENLLEGHPFIDRLIVWNKKEDKYKNLFKTVKEIREQEYDLVVNLQRFSNAGFMTYRSKAKVKLGFKGNFFSSFYTKSLRHEIGNGKHEIERNFGLLNLSPAIQKTSPKLLNPKLHADAVQLPAELESLNNHLVLAPASVWETKKLPEEKWVELLKLKKEDQIVLVGAPGDKELLNRIAEKSERSDILIASNLSLLQSARLISKAKRIYANDSAPLHMGSATNTPVTAFFCSTVPAFGFGPLSENSEIVEVKEALSCRPCGLHGFKACPKQHFDCGNKIIVS